MDKIDLSPDQKIYFRDQLRNARNEAIKDAEGFTELLFVFERLGNFLTKKTGTLKKYESKIAEVANNSPLAKDVPREFHTPFDKLYEIVRKGRNSAMHQGAYARHLTQHAIELSLILEDALMKDLDLVCDFMVRDPSCAYLWQPISFIRQTMLSNSFSYMPVCKEGTWYLVSDYEIAKYLRSGNKEKYDERLATTLKAAEETKGIELILPRHLKSGESVAEALKPDEDTGKTDSDSPIHPGLPMLIFQNEAYQNLVGILTPFDLL